MADASKPCSIAGCNGNAHFSAGGRGGLCQPHDKRKRRLGDPLARYASEVAEVCEVAGCEAPHHAKGYCRPHYERWQKHGDPLGGRHRMETSGPCLVDGCGKPRHGLGYCNDHHYRFSKYGDPCAGPTVQGQPLAWLMARVEYQGDDCLTWPFSMSSHGHGAIVMDGKSMTASRAMCILAHGEPPDPSMHAAHRCGRGHEGCVNPKHLRWLTAAENAADKIAHGTDPRTVAKWRKGRSAHQSPRG